MDEREVILSLSGLTKHYGKRAALVDVNLSFSKGIYGLLGPNGAGKTTLLKLVAGLLPSEEGTILYRNEVVKNQNFLPNLGFLPQSFDFYPSYTALETMTWFAGLKGLTADKEELFRALEQVKLCDVADRKVKTFSGGMKRRLGIAVAFLGKPEVILLDEPTAGLDPAERIRCKDMIEKASKNSVVILSTHILSDLEALQGRVICLKEGRVIREEDWKEQENKEIIDREKEYLAIFGDGSQL